MREFLNMVYQTFVGFMRLLMLVLFVLAIAGLVVLVIFNTYILTGVMIVVAVMSCFLIGGL